MFIYPLTLHSPCTILTLVDSIITAVCIPQVQRAQRAKIRKVKFKLVDVALYIHAPFTMHCAHWLDQTLPRSRHILDNNFDIEDLLSPSSGGGRAEWCCPLCGSGSRALCHFVCLVTVQAVVQYVRVGVALYVHLPTDVAFPMHHPYSRWLYHHCRLYSTGSASAKSKNQKG